MNRYSYVGNSTARTCNTLGLVPTALSGAHAEVTVITMAFAMGLTPMDMTIFWATPNLPQL